jgi:hypothetical protein
MNILEGVKACNYRHDKPRFVIKPKVSPKDREEVLTDQGNASDADVILFIEYMIGKSARLRELVESRAIYNEESFYEKHLLSSVCLVVIFSLRKPS